MENEDNNGKSERILKRVIDLLPTRIFWKDTNLVYLGCNEIFAKDAGKNSSEEVVGKTDYEMGWADQADLYRADDRKVIDSGEEKVNFEEPQTTPNGDKIWLRTSKVQLTSESGEVIGVLGMYADITEWKNAEDKEQKSIEELEKFNKIFVDRELKMSELKKKIDDLEAKLEKLQSK